MEQPDANSANQDAEVLARLVQWHEAADQSTADAREEAERDRDYYDGKQWTPTEVTALEKRKQPVVTINRIKPKVDFLKGQEQQRRMNPRAFPRTPAEEDGASAATDAIRFVMDQSKWDRVRSACFDNHIIEGACGVDVQVYEKKDGDYCIEVKQIPWDRMWGDVYSRMRDWSDGNHKGQYVWMDYEDAVAKWEDKKDFLEATLTTDGPAVQGETYQDIPRTRWADTKRKRIRIVECWSKEGGKYFFTKYTKGGILQREESRYLNENGEQEDGFVFGSCNIDRDGNRYGVVRAWISVQDEINKRRSKAMHLMSVRQTYGNQSIGDKNKLKTELAKPDGHVEMQGGSKFGEDFGVLPTTDMVEAQFKMLQEAKQEIDAVGVNAALSGNEGRVMSGRALMAKSEQGLSELGPVYDAFAQFQHDVYRKVWNRIKQFWTAEKWIRVTDDDKNVKFVGLNAPLTMGEQMLEQAKKQGQQITPEMEQQARQDPQMRVVVGTKNNVAELDVDIVLDEVPASANLQTETFEQLVQIAPHAGSMPPPMFEALIEASPLRNKDKILDKLRGGEEGKIPPQVQQQMAQMQEAGQELEQQLQETQKQLAQAEQRAMKAESIGPAADIAKRELELKYREENFELQKRLALVELQLAQTKAVANVDKAQAGLNAAAQSIQQEAAVAEAPTT